MTVRQSTADTGGTMLEVESTWVSAAKMPPTHLHPAQDEHFEVVEGALRVLIGGAERLMRAGDVFDIPRGVEHAMAAAEGRTRAIWQTAPALRTEQLFAGLADAHRRGGSLLDLAPVVRAHSAEMRLTKPPPIVQGPLFAVLGVAAKILRR
ncbi:cupin domain-containing protein [Phytoactinopolyspora halotolerans]|uniref:Cupin domain-containing protein n=1 Tax=Phytoactinopolyspora halotolerans TaxID=1981512 RepID=A0A6L9S2B7_9ACTN|nr:cupin domain-containing protein [Phytoactinopolyspora halotolerans]NED98773.1 cupin domain-containing protein [Phytoactinopolyspora halotolerans]